MRSRAPSVQGESTSQGEELDDLAAAATPARVRAAGITLLVAGGFGALHVVQLYGVIIVIRGPFSLAPHLMAIETVAALVVGVSLARARGWAAWSAIVVAALLAATSGAWFLFAMANGLFTLFGMFVPGLAMLALVLAFVAQTACLATARARERLEQQGLELGV